MDWTGIINEHGNAFILYARQWARSHADAQDVVQTAIIELCRKNPDREEVPLSHFYRAIRYRGLDMIRSNRRRETRERTAALTLHGEELEPVFQPQAESEVSERIQEALWALPEEQREVVIMKIWGELTFKEIAEALALSINTVSARYRYGLEKLKPRLMPIQ